MDYDTFDTDVFSEINDMPGEIYDVIEDDLKLLFKLCRRFKTDAIKQTYVTN